jgi:hypothetical protein
MSERMLSYTDIGDRRLGPGSAMPFAPATDAGRGHQHASVVGALG